MATKREKEKQSRKKSNALAWAKTQESSGGEATCVKLPEGWEPFKPEKGVYELDIVNYVAGKGNVRADEGMLHFEREFLQHWIPTLSGKNMPYVCATSFGERCPVCERYNRPLDADGEDYLRNIRGKTMHLWIVKILSFDKKPGDGKWRVFQSNHYNKGKGFGEQLVKLLEMDEKNADFADWEDGQTLRVVYEEDSFPGGKYVYAQRLDFIKRVKQYGDLEDELICLDDCLVHKSYAQLKSVLETGTEEVAEDKPPTNGPVRRDPPVEDPDDEDDEKSEPDFEKGDYVLHDQFGRCEVMKIAGDEVHLEDKRGRKHVVNVADCEAMPDTSPKEDDWADEDAEEKPAKRTRAK